MVEIDLEEDFNNKLENNLLQEIQAKETEIRNFADTKAKENLKS